MAWVAKRFHIVVEIILRSGFQLLLHCLVVERTFALLCRYPCLRKDY